jgi:hypothetical protein
MTNRPNHSSAGSAKAPTYHEVLTRLDSIQNLADAEDAAEWVMQFIGQPQTAPPGALKPQRARRS